MDPHKDIPSQQHDSQHWTANAGQPVTDNDNSLTVGVRGPVLLEDYHLTEKLAQFDRERIPERVVHARGATAKGFFEVTHDITHLTCADFLSEVGKQTPLIARLSTVVHERGSPETLRDTRGFAVKFYTQEGNFDLVGNNMPVFFIRDGMKFPDLVHALKPSPVTNVQEGGRIMDFLSHHPESCHILTWLFDDAGIPKNYRTMPGFGVHTFKLLNKQGKETLVKFHWVPKQGTHFMTEEESVQVGGMLHSHATKDLFDTIAGGDFPEWQLCIQTMDPADEDKYDFDPLDATKVWPEEVFPLQPVGRMVLNKNPANQFTENEQVAFCVSMVVPGITYSDDKLMQTRIFSYADTQRHRLGPNYLLLPVNQPKCAYHNNHFDGFMNTTQRDTDINYFPSKRDPVKVSAPVQNTTQVEMHGKREKAVIPKENNFQQAGDRWRSFEPARQQRFVKTVVQKLMAPGATDEVRDVWVGYWTKCDTRLGSAVAAALEEKKQEMAKAK